MWRTSATHLEIFTLITVVETLILENTLSEAWGRIPCIQFYAFAALLLRMVLHLQDQASGEVHKASPWLEG